MSAKRIKTHNELSAEFMARLYRKRQQARVCVVCGGTRTDQRVICLPCRARRKRVNDQREQRRQAEPVTASRLVEWSSLSRKQQYQYSKQHRLCPRCGVPLQRAAFVHCLPCRVAQQERSRRYYAKARAAKSETQTRGAA